MSTPFSFSTLQFPFVSHVDLSFMTVATLARAHLAFLGPQHRKSEYLSFTLFVSFLRKRLSKVHLAWHFFFSCNDWHYNRLELPRSVTM